MTDQRKKGGHCRTGHCRTGLAGVDNDGRPTDWRNLACYRRDVVDQQASRMNK